MDSTDRAAYDAGTWEGYTIRIIPHGRWGWYGQALMHDLDGEKVLYESPEIYWTAQDAEDDVRRNCERMYRATSMKTRQKPTPPDPTLWILQALYNDN